MGVNLRRGEQRLLMLIALTGGLFTITRATSSRISSRTDSVSSVIPSVKHQPRVTTYPVLRIVAALLRCRTHRSAFGPFGASPVRVVLSQLSWAVHLWKTMVATRGMDEQHGDLSRSDDPNDESGKSGR